MLLGIGPDFLGESWALASTRRIAFIMAKVKKPPASIGDSEWLGRVKEVRFPIDPKLSVGVRSWDIKDGRQLSQPKVPSPERHPYCELNFRFEGTGRQFIGAEKIRRTPGDIMMIGPGVPHYAIIESFPMKAVVVYFLPTLLLELGPGSDGPRLLSRFTSGHSIADRVRRPPKTVSARIGSIFEKMDQEFRNPKACSEFALRSCLMQALVEISRWEETTLEKISTPSIKSDWVKMEQVLRFIYSNYTEPLYLEQIGKEVGLSPDGLHALFRDTFGMSCIQYLRGYRISRAASLLLLPGARISEVAISVGFDTFSNFNRSFRHFQAMSPSEYIQRHRPADGTRP